MLRTALISDRRFLKHFAGRSHPERPERAAVMIEMAEQLHRDAILALSPREASIAEVELCHDPAYVAEVKRSASMPRYDFDPDTHASPDSYQTAMLAAGGVLTAAEAVMDGAADNAFAIVRPPGHHALATRAMGFCLFNNVAIAARYLTRHRGLKRVLVVDWDVHHGNGIQDIFYDTPEVLYFSTHQYPFYPGTGALDEIGYGAGAGYTVNAPMPATFGDQRVPAHLRRSAGAAGPAISAGIHPRIVGLRRALSRSARRDAGDRGGLRRARAASQADGGRVLRGADGRGAGGRLRSPGARGFGT